MTERQRFEAWLATTGYAAAHIDNNPEADYECAETQSDWEAWQAAACAGQASKPMNATTPTTDAMLVAFKALYQALDAIGEQLREALAERDRLRAAIQKTLDGNLGLADGENCTLIELKRALEANRR